MLPYEGLGDELLLGISLAVQRVRPPIDSVSLEGPIESADGMVRNACLEMELDFCR